MALILPFRTTSAFSFPWYDSPVARGITFPMLAKFTFAFTFESMSGSVIGFLIFKFASITLPTKSAWSLLTSNVILSKSLPPTNAELASTTILLMELGTPAYFICAFFTRKPTSQPGRFLSSIFPFTTAFIWTSPFATMLS